MGLCALGDSAWLFEAGGHTALGRLKLVLRVANLLERERIPEVRDIVSSFTSVAVHFDPADGAHVLNWLTSLPAPSVEETPTHARLIEIPVSYGGENGPDLSAASTALGLCPTEIIHLHSTTVYTVAAIGFSPGFPYLHGLPDALTLPRHATPRPVAAGSIAIAGNQAGIYPFASQGGWHILGRTGLNLFDPFLTEPTLLKPGDQVKFIPTDGPFNPPKMKMRYRAGGGLEIIEPGAFTTVQDLGRPGYQSLGVSPGGAVDSITAKVCNRLLGNADACAVLECCMTGPLLKFHHDVQIAFSGWQHPQSGKPLHIPAGEVFDLRQRLNSVRGYIAISGGIDTPVLMGSRATDVRSGFGGHQGRCLKSGDMLPVGKPSGSSPRAGHWHVAWPRTQAPARMLELRYLTGMQAGWFSPAARLRFQKSIYHISPMSDRMGARLDGPSLELSTDVTMVSQPVVAGSIQVPPDGKPIVLLSERQTIGGYPQIGHVISADLPLLGRAWPGTPIRFTEVTLDEARTAWAALQRDLTFLQSGLGFLR